MKAQLTLDTQTFMAMMVAMGYKFVDNTVYPKPSWATRQIRRGGMIEDICKHGVGHPNALWLAAHPHESGVHGCDGCCCQKPRKSRTTKRKTK